MQPPTPPLPPAHKSLPRPIPSPSPHPPSSSNPPPPAPRLLKDARQDSQFSGRYQHLLAALLCCVGRGLRDEFDRQSWLVSILATLAQCVRDASPSSRQVCVCVCQVYWCGCGGW